MIVPLSEAFRPRVMQYVVDEWAGPMIVTRGAVHDASKAEGFISVTDGDVSGYVLYRVQENQCEILVLHSILENRGIGSALIRTVIEVAKARGCARVWLITTNDNLHAIRFYQRFGFALKAVHINALDESRKLKPTIPLRGNEGIPIAHEFEFEYDL